MSGKTYCTAPSFAALDRRDRQMVISLAPIFSPEAQGERNAQHVNQDDAFAPLPQLATRQRSGRLTSQYD